MQIIEYTDKYKQQVIELILHIQNDEAGIALGIDEQPDLLDVDRFYLSSGGMFWLAVDGEQLIGTIALMDKGSGGCVLKKFFVAKKYRSKGVGFALYKTFLAYAKEHGFEHVVLDTPSVAKASHRFYEKAGFVRIDKTQLPFEYTYPDRASLLYLLTM